jgi:hypothetical protein
MGGVETDRSAMAMAMAMVGLLGGRTLVRDSSFELWWVLQRSDQIRSDHRSDSSLQIRTDQIVLVKDDSDCKFLKDQIVLVKDDSDCFLKDQIVLVKDDSDCFLKDQIVLLEIRSSFPKMRLFSLRSDWSLCDRLLSEDQIVF